MIVPSGKCKGVAPVRSREGDRAMGPCFWQAGAKGYGGAGEADAEECLDNGAIHKSC